MIRLFEYLVLAAVVLLAVTEFFYPILAGKPLFGSFRKSQPKEVPKVDLDDKVQQAKEKVQEVKAVQKEVDQHFKDAEKLKDDADDLLNP